jgi:CRISPR/Cas system-associated endonuclease Cas1
LPAKLGNVTLNAVYSEKPVRSVKTTDQPVEEGVDIVDHVQAQPKRMEITGVVTGSDASMSLKRLEAYQTNGTMVQYTGRNGFTDVIIESFNSVHDATNKGAFNFTITLKQIRIASAAAVVRLKIPQKARAQVGKKGNKGRKQTQTPAQMAAANGNHVKGNTVTTTTFRGANRNLLE